MDAETRQYLEAFKQDFLNRLDQFENHMEKLSEARFAPLDREITQVREQLKNEVYPRLTESEKDISRITERVDANEESLKTHVSDSSNKSQFSISMAIALIAVIVSAIAIFF